MQVVLRPADLEEALESVEGHRPGRLQGQPRLPREVHPPGPPRRDPGDGRPPRQRGLPRRARLLDPAPPAEADRGVALHLHRRRPAPAHGRGGGGGGQGDRLRERGDHGVPGRPRQQLLLHGDEHPHPGRAPGHRGDHRPRPHRADDPRGRRASRCPSSRRTSSRAGHAIECRINAEDPAKNWAPASGTLTRFIPPGGPDVRVDTHGYTGYMVPPFYDSLLAKVIVHGRDREDAMNLMLRALHEFACEGIKTTIPFHQELLAHPVFRSGDYHLDFLEKYMEPDGTLTTPEESRPPGAARAHGERQAGDERERRRREQREAPWSGSWRRSGAARRALVDASVTPELPAEPARAAGRDHEDRDRPDERRDQLAPGAGRDQQGADLRGGHGRAGPTASPRCACRPTRASRAGS